MSCNGFQRLFHSNSFQPIPILLILLSKSPLMSLQPIPIHSSPFRLISTHSNSFQPIQILLIFLSKSALMSLQPISIHSNPFRLIPTHLNLVVMSIKIALYVIVTISSSFQPILIHSNSFQSNLFQFSWNLYQNHPLPLQSIPIHSYPIQLIPTHSNPVEISIKITPYVITFHNALLNLIVIKFSIIIT